MKEHKPPEAKPGRQKPPRVRSGAQPEAEKPWSMPISIAEIPATGRRVELKPDAATRAAVAAAVGVVALPRLEAVFDLAPLASDGVRVSGSVTASVEQNCIVTLEPVLNEVGEKIDLVLVRPGAEPAPRAAVDIDATGEDDTPDVLHDGVLDLGAMATEFLLLGIDPYPRKPGRTSKLRRSTTIRRAAHSRRWPP